jgi:hypothetical protein
MWVGRPSLCPENFVLENFSINKQQIQTYLPRNHIAVPAACHRGMDVLQIKIETD